MNRLLRFLLCCLVTGLAITSCKKNNASAPGGPEVIPLDTSKLGIPVSQGQIGLILDTRPIAKKGYKPAYISLSVTNGASFSFSDDHMEVDPFTNLAIWRIPKDSVSESEAEQFAKGIPVKIKVYDKTGGLLAELNENSLPVSANIVPILIETQKPKIIPPLKVIAGAPYIIQALPVGNYEGGSIWTYAYGMINEGLVGGDPLKAVENPFIGLSTNYIRTNDEAGQIFTFEQVGDDDSLFYIKANGKKDKYLFIDKKYGVLIYTGKPADLPDDDYRFILSQDAEGGITIKSYKHDPLKINKGAIDGLSPKGTIPVKFRLIPADIEWQAQDMGISYDQPIMQPAQLDFALSSTIRNCGATEVRQNIGQEKTRTTTITAGSEESFSVTTQHQANVEFSITMGVSADLFGVAGVERSLSLTAGYTFSHTETETNVSRFDTTTETQTTVSYARDITVPPYTIMDAYDAVQTYPNVVVLYVQKIRVTASLNGKPLTGDEIVSQLIANQFGGVVTETGDTYVTISVRGKVNIKNLMKSVTETKTRPCDG
jgi:hypothetical protein